MFGLELLSCRKPRAGYGRGGHTPNESELTIRYIFAFESDRSRYRLPLASALMETMTSAFRAIHAGDIGVIHSGVKKIRDQGEKK